MRPHEQHTLDLIAADLAASDPRLARDLSTPSSGTPRGSRRVDTWLRGATVLAVWLIGIACGATLLGFGLVRHAEVTIAVGAAMTAAVIAFGVLITSLRLHHLSR